MSDTAPKTYQVPDNAAWYVKHGLGRAIEYTSDAIKRMQKFIEKPETPEILRDEFLHSFDCVS